MSERLNDLRERTFLQFATWMPCEKEYPSIYKRLIPVMFPPPKPLYLRDNFLVEVSTDPTHQDKWRQAKMVCSAELALLSEYQRTQRHAFFVHFFGIHPQPLLLLKGSLTY